MDADFNIFTVCADSTDDTSADMEDAPVSEDDEKSFSGLLEDD